MKQLGIPGIAGVLPGEDIIDLFAGGGGASAGIEAALGRPPDIAINHDPHAIQMHERNHPATRHFCQSVFHREVHPRDLVRGRRVGLLWFSPDCRHFSRAKGSAPVSASVRGLCWIGLRWAKFARPRVAILENVPEFLTFGPLLPNGKPDPKRAGEYFRAFVREWQRYGYVVEWRIVVCADHGAPTTRKRLFLVARCDGEPIAWPEPTHGKDGSPRPWRTAAECIDWSLPCRSIFGRKKPLADKTLRRIARGMMRYVLNGRPFLVRTDMHQSNAGCAYSADEPLRTVTSGGGHAAIAPIVMEVAHGDHVQRPGDRSKPVGAPLGIVTRTNNHALVAAFLAKHNGGTTGQPLTEPMHTIAGNINKAVVAAHLSVFRQNSVGQDLAGPVPTITAGGGRGGGSMALVAAFLVAYYSQGKQDQPLDEPLATIVTRARHGVVTFHIDGTDYAIVDIGMRMLEPRELANAQGFDPGYVLTGNKSQQIARIGNSVCPPVAAAVVGANLAPPRARRSAA